MSSGWYGRQGDPSASQVYALLEPGTRRPRYIGVAQSATARLTLHWQQRSRRTAPVAIWLRSLPVPPEVWVIQVVEREFGRRPERYWIKLLQEVLGDMLNVTHTPAASDVYRAAVTSERRGQVRSQMRELHQKGDILQAPDETSG